MDTVEFNGEGYDPQVKVGDHVTAGQLLIKFDIDGIKGKGYVKFYEEMLSYLNEKGIEPLMTLHHHEQPVYLAEYFDGWYDRRVIDLFVRYAKTYLNTLVTSCATGSPSTR